jgi:hypothetical protein
MANSINEDSRANVQGSISGIEHTILAIRGERVILDRELAKLYGVENRVLGQAVKRNIRRFPAEFLLQMSQEEFVYWKSQVVISNTGDKMWLRKLPYAFTEHGVAMLSSVLRSEQAIEVNIAIMRAFSKLCRILLENKDLAVKLNNLERKYDKQFRVVFDAIREMMEPDVQNTKRKMGFHRD